MWVSLFPWSILICGDLGARSKSAKKARNAKASAAIAENRHRYSSTMTSMASESASSSSSVPVTEEIVEAMLMLLIRPQLEPAARHASHASHARHQVVGPVVKHGVGSTETSGTFRVITVKWTEVLWAFGSEKPDPTRFWSCRASWRSSRAWGETWGIQLTARGGESGG